MAFRSSLALACSLPLALGGCDGIGLVSPTTTARLDVEGRVVDAVTGAPVPAARVAIMLDLWVEELVSVFTDSTGHYSLRYTLRRVATDRELRDSCHVWRGDRARGVYLTAEADGYADGFTGWDGTKDLQCTDTAQTIDFHLKPDASGF